MMDNATYDITVSMNGKETVCSICLGVSVITDANRETRNVGPDTFD